MISIVEQIFENAEKYPEKVALINGKEKIAYKNLVHGILLSKERLERIYGLNNKDAVIIAADKQLEFVMVYFACHMIGAVVLPIAPDTNKNRYYLIRKKTHPVLVAGFVDDSNDCRVVELKDIISATDLLNNGDGEGLSKKDVVVFPEADAIADIIFTTGTTGEPKGVQLSQKNIAAAAHNINTFIRNSLDDVEMLALPISHSFGIGRMRCALSNGQTLVMLGSFANVKKFFRLMEEYKVTGFGMVPASWALLRKLSGERIGDFKNQLNYIEIGSAPMPMENKELLMRLLPTTRICMHYGLTEASRSAFIEFHGEKDKLYTVGKQSPNMLISIKDEDGKNMPNGQEGEICVSGDAVTVGYLNIPKEESFFGEYFRTGDWGTRDEDGYITLKSRKKELINVGGKKVSPLEVEEVLKQIDFIRDCACIAVPDPEAILGEVVKAYIVTDEPERVSYDIIDGMIGTKLEGYKHPAEYSVVDEIPKTTSGKVQRLLLK